MKNFSVIELAILQMIEQTPLHGYAMSQKLMLFSGGALQLPPGSLYPALGKLERAGLIWSKDDTVGKRTRHIYALTGSGYQALAEMKHAWYDISKTIDALVQKPYTSMTSVIAHNDGNHNNQT